MGKGARERNKRRSTEHVKVTSIDESAAKKPKREPTEEERAIFNSIAFSFASRRGIVAVRSGKVDKEQLAEVIEADPKAHVHVIELREEGES